MANVIRIGGGGAGGSTITLPPMVTNLKAVGSDATITVIFTNPVSEALAGVMVVYNDDHVPTKPSDGKKFDAGLTQQAVITGLQNGTEYFIRVFPYNEKKQYQTLIDGSTISATPNVGPAQVTNLQVTGTGSSPVLTWINPIDDPTYHETVVIQKVDSAPTSLSDGTEIYRGTGETVSANGLERLKNYYWGVFTINAEGGTRGPVVSDVYNYDFPAEPTEYAEIEKIYATREWEAPEDGWFKFIIASKGGRGGASYCSSWGNNTGIYFGTGGGSPGCAVSEIAMNKGEKMLLTVSATDITCSVKGVQMVSTRGEDGGWYASNPNSNGGDGGTATGGNKSNHNGIKGGSTGDQQYSGDYYGSTVAGRSGGNLQVDGYSFYGGTGGGGTRILLENRFYVWGAQVPPTNGSSAVCIVLRGNTNIPAPSQVSTLSLTPRNASIEASWTNSEDPESVGTLLVSNPTHEPQDITDGTAMDVAEATSYTLTDLPNDKPTYISLFSYNADKSKYSAAKSNVEIPREVTWADTVEEAQQEAKEATDKAAVAEEQAKQANETLQAKTEELAQTSAELTEKQVMVDSATATFNALIASDIQNDTKVISDNMILDNAEMLSKPWEVGTPNEVGDIVWYMIGDVKQYYKVVQPTENADPNHTPNIVPAVFVAINKTNAGTIDDPIPAVRGMEYEYGKYYLDNEDGKIYICKRGEETGTIVLQYLPHELIGHYFELATLTE